MFYPFQTTQLVTFEKDLIFYTTSRKFKNHLSTHDKCHKDAHVHDKNDRSKDFIAKNCNVRKRASFSSFSEQRRPQFFPANFVVQNSISDRGTAPKYAPIKSYLK